jgi:hypothetical protein
LPLAAPDRLSIGAGQGIPALAFGHWQRSDLLSCSQYAPDQLPVFAGHAKPKFRS